jgi:hypothetical protein
MLVLSRTIGEVATASLFYGLDGINTRICHRHVNRMCDF